MTQDQFYNWLENPSTMDASSILQIREVIKQYPYFQAAQVMLARNLKQENHIDQLNQLQLAAVMAPDRKLFRDYLHGKKKSEPELKVVEVPENETLPKKKPKKEETEHSFPDNLIPEPIVYQLETAELPDLSHPKIEQENKEEKEPEELSFSEWLAYTNTGKTEKEPVKKAQSTRKKKAPGRSNTELISHFLTQQTENPKKRAEFFNPQKLGAKSTEEDFTVISETLAKIYEEQEKYELATQAYQALSLKYPEKSVYFAARLKEIDEKLNTEN